MLLPLLLLMNRTTTRLPPLDMLPLDKNNLSPPWLLQNSNSKLIRPQQQQPRPFHAPIPNIISSLPTKDLPTQLNPHSPLPLQLFNSSPIKPALPMLLNPLSLSQHQPFSSPLTNSKPLRTDLKPVNLSLPQHSTLLPSSRCTPMLTICNSNHRPLSNSKPLLTDLRTALSYPLPLPP